MRELTPEIEKVIEEYVLSILVGQDKETIRLYIQTYKETWVKGEIELPEVAE